MGKDDDKKEDIKEDLLQNDAFGKGGKKKKKKMNLFDQIGWVGMVIVYVSVLIVGMIIYTTMSSFAADHAADVSGDVEGRAAMLASQADETLNNPFVLLALLAFPVLCKALQMGAKRFKQESAARKAGSVKVVFENLESKLKQNAHELRSALADLPKQEDVDRIMALRKRQYTRTTDKSLVNAAKSGTTPIQKADNISEAQFNEIRNRGSQAMSRDEFSTSSKEVKRAMTAHANFVVATAKEGVIALQAGETISREMLEAMIHAEDSVNFREPGALDAPETSAEMQRQTRDFAKEYIKMSNRITALTEVGGFPDIDMNVYLKKLQDEIEVKDVEAPTSARPTKPLPDDPRWKRAPPPVRPEPVTPKSKIEFASITVVQFARLTEKEKTVLENEYNRYKEAVDERNKANNKEYKNKTKEYNKKNLIAEAEYDAAEDLQIAWDNYDKDVREKETRFLSQMTEKVKATTVKLNYNKNAKELKSALNAALESDADSNFNSTLKKLAEAKRKRNGVFVNVYDAFHGDQPKLNAASLKTKQLKDLLSKAT